METKATCRIFTFQIGTDKRYRRAVSHLGAVLITVAVDKTVNECDSFQVIREPPDESYLLGGCSRQKAMAVVFQQTLAGGALNVNQLIHLQCEPLGHCNRFSVNLRHQANQKSILHLDFRFDQNCTVRNCEYPNGWGAEERGPLTVQRGRLLDMQIQCLVDRFMVTLNGAHYCEFRHRAAFSLADSVDIRGDVRVHWVNAQVHQPSAPGWIPPPQGNHQSGLQRLNFYNPVVPFKAGLCGPLAVGQSLEVHGQVKPNANRFQVNLETSSGAEVALHVNPRFEGGQRVLVLNSRSAGGGWAAEQRVTGPTNPFQPHRSFQLSLRRQWDAFDVLVNGRLVARFQHRMSADAADTVAVEGDVVVQRAFISG